MRQELEKFRVEAETFEASQYIQEYDGYDCMEYAYTKRWYAVPDWGKEGWLLGDWPLVIVFFRDRPGCYEVAHYVERDIEVYACPSREIRDQITDELAFYHWQIQHASWIEGFENIEQARHLLGPYRRSRE